MKRNVCRDRPAPLTNAPINLLSAHRKARRCARCASRHFDVQCPALVMARQLALIVAIPYTMQAAMRPNMRLY
jgi:hypothetical protein